MKKMKGFLVKSVTFFLCVCLGVPGSLASVSPYCFNLTWLGPSYSAPNWIAPNISNTCTEAGDFCVQPLVVTNDSTPPDFQDLWTNSTINKDAITCTPNRGLVCVKWTSFFDGVVEYTTHTCSRVIVDGEGSMTSGCVTSTPNNSRTIEVCACNSMVGKIPCNTGQHPYTSITVTGLLVVLFLALICVT